MVIPWGTAIAGSWKQSLHVSGRVQVRRHSDVILSWDPETHDLPMPVGATTMTSRPLSTSWQISSCGARKSLYPQSSAVSVDSRGMRASDLLF